MMDFDKFLKEKSVLKSPQKENRGTTVMPYIRVWDLGEWAYQIFLENADSILNDSEAYNLQFFFKTSESTWEECIREASDYASSIVEIEIDFMDQLHMAIACLGKEEVGNRLNKLRDKQDLTANDKGELNKR